MSLESALRAATEAMGGLIDGQRGVEAEAKPFAFVGGPGVQQEAFVLDAADPRARFQLSPSDARVKAFTAGIDDPRVRAATIRDPRISEALLAFARITWVPIISQPFPAGPRAR